MRVQATCQWARSSRSHPPVRQVVLGVELAGASRRLCAVPLGVLHAVHDVDGDHGDDGQPDAEDAGEVQRHEARGVALLVRLRADEVADAVWVQLRRGFTCYLHEMKNRAFTVVFFVLPATLDVMSESAMGTVTNHGTQLSVSDDRLTHHSHIVPREADHALGFWRGVHDCEANDGHTARRYGGQAAVPDPVAKPQPEAIVDDHPRADHAQQQRLERVESEVLGSARSGLPQTNLDDDGEEVRRDAVGD